MNISFIKQKNIVFLQTDQRAIHLLFRIWTPSFTLLLFLINTGSFGAGGLHCGSEERKEPTSISAQSFYQTEGGGKLSVPVLLQQIRTDFFARTTNDKSWLILENLEILERDVIWLKTAGFRLEAQNNCWNFLFAWRKQTTFSLLTQEVFVKKWKRCRNCFLERFSHHASPLFWLLTCPCCNFPVELGKVWVWLRLVMSSIQTKTRPVTPYLCLISYVWSANIDRNYRCTSSLLCLLDNNLSKN